MYFVRRAASIVASFSVKFSAEENRNVRWAHESLFTSFGSVLAVCAEEKRSVSQISKDLLESNRSIRIHERAD